MIVLKHTPEYAIPPPLSLTDEAMDILQLSVTTRYGTEDQYFVSSNSFQKNPNLSTPFFPNYSFFSVRFFFHFALPFYCLPYRKKGRELCSQKERSPQCSHCAFDSRSDTSSKMEFPILRKLLPYRV
ncbi:hypothetical protein TNIN_362831 [Trichonephila inaurata madagascariensis]|uniref:Uncharacterized protein n=1 Tax=Trichonephila inaurata madagascariensis TaxID=2747483 RepID=A0A8X6YL44_9ARAC|nr:hypothetical protein TNIN_362831 [Trichonephila inaurata madagascariensis]